MIKYLLWELKAFEFHDIFHGRSRRYQKTGSIHADYNHSSHKASREAIRQVIASPSDDTPSSGADIL